MHRCSGFVFAYILRLFNFVFADLVLPLFWAVIVLFSNDSFVRAVRYKSAAAAVPARSLQLSLSAALRAFHFHPAAHHLLNFYWAIPNCIVMAGNNFIRQHFYFTNSIHPISDIYLWHTISNT
ncbi:MAG: hypothetical protein M3R72_11835 [Bacteroidota bacterium]|nr:hypothetical protein [Bacteroidota bacterium]